MTEQKNTYIAQERSRDGRVLYHVEFPSAELAWDFWSRRMSGAAPAGTYAPNAPRRLVLLGPDRAVKP